MYLSDPQVSRQFGEYAVWWDPPHILDTDPQLLPCGRLHGGPTYFRIGIAWTSSPLVLPSDTNQLLLFENQFLKREYAQQLQPTADMVKWLSSTLPQIAVLNSHHRSSKFTIPFSVYDKMTWYLVYGSGDTIGAYQFTDLPDYTKINFNLQNQDSSGQSSGTTIDDPPTWVGWTLLLIRQVFTLASDPALPPIVSYHTYGAWSLEPPEDESPTVFYPEENSIWLPYHNPLNFPPHQIILSP